MHGRKTWARVPDEANANRPCARRRPRKSYTKTSISPNYEVEGYWCLGLDCKDLCLMHGRSFLFFAGL